jgi:hypothetical protein
MAIGVLVLWIFTAGAGFYLLITSNLRGNVPVSAPPVPQPASVAQAATTAQPASVARPASLAQAAQPVSATQAALAAEAASAASAGSARARRDPFAPPSLVAARQAPVLPGRRALLEFAHPASGIIGLAFWLGFTLVHNRIFGWIGFGLVTATACAGLTWFTLNTRATRRHNQASRDDQTDPPPSLNGRLVAIHGGAAALTFALAALSALVLRG